MATKNIVRSNIVSQVPYFITAQYTSDANNAVVKLVDTFRYYNNQTVDRDLYGALNINASFNGAHADWKYKTIALTAAPTSQVDKNAVVFAGGDEALFSAGSYFRVKSTGELVLVDSVNTTTHTVYFRRQLFDTAPTTFAAGDVLFQMNTIEVIPTQTVVGTNDDGFIEIWANPMLGPSRTGFFTH